MDSITLQGPAVVLPADAYHDLLNRLDMLEKRFDLLATRLEDSEDLRIMREAEIEYQSGDAVSFADLVAAVTTKVD